MRRNLASPISSSSSSSRPLAALAAIAIALAVAPPSAHARLAPRQLLRVSGLTALYAGGPGSLAITLVEREPKDKAAPERPIAGAAVKVTLEGDPPVTLFEGTTDATGAAVARFVVPAGVKGTRRLRVVSSHADGEQFLVVDVDVRDPSDERLLHLATDKPLYQPGHTIEMRALVVRAVDLHALAYVPAVFEVRAPGGELVHKAEETTSPFGVASSKLPLGPEIPLGTYTVTIESSGARATKTVSVSKYALAAHKVEVDLDRPYYRRGERIVARLKALYSWGKPVVGASLDLNLVATIGGAPVSLYRTYATTDAEGRFTFDWRLPTEHWALAKGFKRAPLSLEVVATDRGGESIVAGASSVIAEDVLLVRVVPGRTPLVAGVPNPVFVVAHYPDGAPAADCAVRVAGVGEGITGAAGVARFEVTPKAAGSLRLEMELADAFGNRATLTEALEAGRAGLVVRTERSLYAAGDTVAFEVLVPEAARGATGSVHVDVARRGLLVDSFLARVKDGRARVEMKLGADGWGTLVAHAHLMVGKDQWTGSGAVWVRPARSLTVSLTPDATTYAPGAEAKLGVDVKDEGGKGVASAVMIKIVDERLYAIEDSARERLLLYFTLAEALRRPEDAELGEASRVGFGAALTKKEEEKAAKAEAAARDLAAGLLLAAYGGDAGGSALFAADSEAQAKARARAELASLAGKLREARAWYTYDGKIGRPIDWLVKHGGLAKDSATDPWGRGWVVEGRGAFGAKWWLVSLGPDGERGTKDDLEEELFR